MKRLKSLILASLLLVSTLLFLTPYALAATTFPIPGVNYYIINRGSSKVLDVSGGSTAEKANIQQYSKVDVDQQKWTFEDAGDGNFYVVSKKSGKVLDVNNANLADGANVQQYSKNQTNAQKWKLEDAGDGYFYLVNKNSSKVLDVNSGSLADAANVQQYSKNQTNAQKWKLEPIIATNPVTINNSGTIITEAGKLTKVQVTVDIPADIGYNNTFGIFKINDDGSVAGVKPGADNYAETVVKNRILLADVDKGFYKKGQTFKYELPGGSKYGVFLIANGTPEQFLQKNPTNKASEPPLAYFFDTSANPDQKNHVKVSSDKPNQYGFEDMYGGGDQDFDDLIVKLETITEPSSTTAQTPLPTPGKTYYLTNKNSSKVLDVAGGSIANMANIQQYSKVDVDQQKWILKDAGDGYYFLVSKKSGKVAAIDVNSSTNKDNALQYDNVESEDQKWKVEDAGDGYFYLVNKKSGKVLEVTDSSSDNGGNVQQHTKDQPQTNNQKWKFEAA